MITVLLRPVTNYASETVPEWAQNPWLAWSAFAALGTVALGLLLWGRRLDGAAQLSELTPVGPVAAAGHGSLRFPHPPSPVRGRSTELHRLTRLLHRPAGKFAVLCAAGGMGKTTLAAALAEQAEREGHQVWWIRWRNATTLAEHFTQVALACGLSEEELQAAHAGQRNLRDVVWEQLARTRKWLLVLDNVDNPDLLDADGEHLAAYRGWIRPHGGGLLLVTSRDGDRDVWGPQADPVRLTTLDKHEGGRVLRDLAPQAGGAEESRALAARLGGLPLALRAAGTFLATATLSDLGKHTHPSNYTGRTWKSANGCWAPNTPTPGQGATISPLCLGTRARVAGVGGGVRGGHEEVGDGEPGA